MKSRWVLAAAAVAIVLLAVVLRRIPTDSVAAEPFTRIETPRPADVHVQHTWLTVEPVAIPLVMEEAPAPREPRRLATVSARSRPAQPETLMTRARKAFFGDGRHRPQPFPRIKEN